MKVRKTTFEEAQKAKEAAWFALTPLQRLAWHEQMLRRIYGERFNAPLPPEALKIRIKRG